MSHLEPRRYLAIYLNDHLLGATAGVELAKRMRASEHVLVAHEAARLAREIEEDRESLLRTMRALGAEPSTLKQLLGLLGERLGRLKPNGHLLERSPLSTVIELESLSLGIGGKQALWALLARLASSDPRLERDQLNALRERAEEQRARVEELRLLIGADLLAAQRPASAMAD